MKSKIKLHLGCGESYLKGYVNIDYPLSKHSVQRKSCADMHADILSLQYSAETVEEIRLHHVFEHFPRQIACALLVSWRSWLKPGGILIIETPDFDRTAINIISPFSSYRTKYVALRHIFGSHEAKWADHLEGWSTKRLKSLLELYEFKINRIKKTSYKHTYNFEITAKKNNNIISKKEFESRTNFFLSNYLIDNSLTERRLLSIWLKIYNHQIEKSWSK